MTKKIKTLQDVINQLDKIHWIDADDNTLIAEDFKLVVNFKFSTFDFVLKDLDFNKMLVDIELNIFHKNVHAFVWGIENNEQADVFRLWMIRKRHYTFHNKMQLQSDERDEAKKAFDSL